MILKKCWFNWGYSSFVMLLSDLAWLLAWVANQDMCT